MYNMNNVSKVCIGEAKEAGERGFVRRDDEHDT